jgi:hypothetical protein
MQGLLLGSFSAPQKEVLENVQGWEVQGVLIEHTHPHIEGAGRVESVCHLTVK